MQSGERQEEKHDSAVVLMRLERERETRSCDESLYDARMSDVDHRRSASAGPIATNGARAGAHVKSPGIMCVCCDHSVVCTTVGLRASRVRGCVYCFDVRSTRRSGDWTIDAYLMIYLM